jgi:electron transport complex protein RnfG
MNDMVKMILAIVIFATVACVGLAFVYDGTKVQIEANATEKLNNALSEVFPGAEKFEKVSTQLSATGGSGVTFGDAYSALKGGLVAGIAINATDAGFNDAVTALVGVGTDGKISGVRMLVNTDTPGLGANASNPAYFVDKPAKIKTFYGQFDGMSVTGNIKVQKDGGEVIAITAATITSRAVSLLVSESAKAGKLWLTANNADATDAASGALENGGAVDGINGTEPGALENGGVN